jgi:hypothetical protein
MPPKPAGPKPTSAKHPAAKPAAKAAAKPAAKAPAKKGPAAAATKKPPIDEKKQLDEWHEKYDATWAKYEPRGRNGLRKGDLAAQIRDANEDFGFLSDSEYGPFVKKAFVECSPNEESNTVSFANWAPWYEAFEALLEGEKTKAAAEAQAKAEAKASVKAARFGGKGTWACDLSELSDALDAACALRIPSRLLGCRAMARVCRH